MLKFKKYVSKSRKSEMRKFFENSIDASPIAPRVAYFGGRTGACVSKFTNKKSEYVIRYFDFKSLYPWINYITQIFKKNVEKLFS